MKTQDATIDGKRYQIGQIPARGVSWIIAQLFTKVGPSTIAAVNDKMTESFTGKLPDDRQQLSESEFHNIQDLCLKACSQYRAVGSSEVAVRVLNPDGRFGVPELEYDAVAILALTVESLKFNLSPFFKKGAMETILGTFQGADGSTPSLAPAAN